MVGSALLGAVVMIGLAPDTGPDVPDPAPLAVLPRPAPAPAARASEALPDREPAPEPAPLPEPEPPPEPELPSHDLDQVYAASTEGVASAALARRTGVLECYRDYVERWGPTPGHPTLRVDVVPDPADPTVGRASAGFAQAEAGREDFEACLGAVFDGATFALPSGAPAGVFWPLPVTRADLEAAQQ